MIETGIIRRFDDLGRINIPKELRKRLFGAAEKSEGKPMEIYIDGEDIILRKYPEADDVCEWKLDGVYLHSPHNRPFVTCIADDEDYRYNFCPVCGKT